VTGLSLHDDEDVTMKNFGDVFRDVIDGIHRDAADLGISMARVCAGAGVAEPTPRRYSKALPATIRNVIKLEAEIAKRRATAGGRG
jgi:hypothetical protein